MSKKVLNELVASVRESGAILRGEAEASRLFELPPNRRRRNPEAAFAVCLKTDDPELLVPHKIYRITMLNDARVKLIDEAGEAANYPASFFMPVVLPRELERALSQPIQ